MTFCSGHGKGTHGHSSTLKLLLLPLTAPPFPKCHTLCIHIPAPSERTHTPMDIHTRTHILAHKQTHTCSHILKHPTTCLHSFKTRTSAHTHTHLRKCTSKCSHQGPPSLAASVRPLELRVIGHSQDDNCMLSGKPGPHGGPPSGCHGYGSACTFPPSGTCLGFRGTAPSWPRGSL